VCRYREDIKPASTAEWTFNNAINCNTFMKRQSYNTRFILFRIVCKYVFMSLTELAQHGNGELLTTT